MQGMCQPRAPSAPTWGNRSACKLENRCGNFACRSGIGAARSAAAWHGDCSVVCVSIEARGIVRQALVRTYQDDALQLCAAIAYYSLLSMAPLLLVAIAIAGVFFADGTVHAQLVAQLEKLVGAEGAALAKTVIASTESEERSQWSLLLGAVLTLVGATTVFAQLQNALNRVWRVEAVPGNALLGFIKHRLLSFALVLSIGFLLMISLVISALLGALHSYLDERLAAATFFWSALDLAITFGFSAVLIAAMFKYLPDAKIAWRDSWFGAFVTALLLVVGKHLIGFYLGQTSVASAFGAAGSVVVFMIWVYYAALILLFGAEITQAVAAQRGAAVEPSEHATPREA
jgi:membrane protein